MKTKPAHWVTIRNKEWRGKICYGTFDDLDNLPPFRAVATNYNPKTMPRMSHLDYLRYIASKCNWKTNAEVAKANANKEGELHTQILRDCRNRGWYVIHARTDRPSTIAVGAPDFVIFAENRVLIVECKCAKGKLRPEQKAMIAWLGKLGFQVHVMRCYSDWHCLSTLGR